MPLVQLVIYLVVVGVLLWLVNSYIPMDSKIKSILNVVVVIAVVIWLLNVTGLLSGISGLRIGAVGNYGVESSVASTSWTSRRDVQQRLEVT